QQKPQMGERGGGRGVRGGWSGGLEVLHFSFKVLCGRVDVWTCMTKREGERCNFMVSPCVCVCVCVCVRACACVCVPACVRAGKPDMFTCTCFCVSIRLEDVGLCCLFVLVCVCVSVRLLEVSVCICTCEGKLCAKVYIDCHIHVCTQTAVLPAQRRVKSTT